MKVGPVEACKIDYSKSVEELTAYYDDLAKRIAGGQPELANGEFMQLGYALDFIDLVKRVFNMDLDFEETSIPKLDQIIAALSQAILTKKIPPEAGGDIMKKASGFLSVVIWRNIGGGFISSNIGYGVNINGTNAFVYNRIGRRLQGDASSDVTNFSKNLRSCKRKLKIFRAVSDAKKHLKSINNIEPENRTVVGLF